MFGLVILSDCSTHTLVIIHVEIKLLAKKLLQSWMAFTVSKDAMEAAAHVWGGAHVHTYT